MTKKENFRAWLNPFFLLLCLGVFVGSLVMFYRQTWFEDGGLYGSDIVAYFLDAQGVHSAENVFPYRFYFLCIKGVHWVFRMDYHWATALATAGLNLFAMWVTYYFVRTYFVKNKTCLPTWANTKWKADAALTGILLGTFYASMIIVPHAVQWGLLQNRFLGQYSGNPWHNATYLATRGFAVAAFFLFAQLMNGVRRGEQPNGKLLAVFGASLFMTTATKPSFTFVLVPVAGLWLAYSVVKGRLRGKDILWTFLCFVPTFCLLVQQYFAVFGAGEGIGIQPLAVFRFYTPHFVFSFLLAMAFPLFILATNGKLLLKDTLFGTAWACWLVGFATAALLVEKGTRMYHGNFMWGYMHGIFFVFLASLLVLGTQWKSCKVGYRTTALCLLGLHLVSGLWYYGQVLQGLNYT